MVESRPALDSLLLDESRCQPPDAGTVTRFVRPGSARRRRICVPRGIGPVLMNRTGPPPKKNGTVKKQCLADGDSYPAGTPRTLLCSALIARVAYSSCKKGMATWYLH